MSPVAVDPVEAPHNSCLATEQYPWKTAPSYEEVVVCSREKFEEISNLLLSQPQLNSSHLFRADILYDDCGILQTPAQKEAAMRHSIKKQHAAEKPVSAAAEKGWSSPVSQSLITSLGLELTRTVVRRLIPRKPKVDRALEQTCFMFHMDSESKELPKRQLVVYRPHVESTSAMPWYHPSVKALAFYYHVDAFGASMSIHFLPFDTELTTSVPNRLHRTMLSLLNTLARLARPNRSIKKPTPQGQTQQGALAESIVSGTGVDMNNISLAPSTLKDTVIAQHLVQDTYSRLKEKYAFDLISRWVESTEPSKHVFEDLAIAAFLIKLWDQMYSDPNSFPGFIDIACGNGLLVYILTKEGYSGRGFDARRRKTWEMLQIQSYLTEQVCIPQPFLDALSPTAIPILPHTPVHNGIVPSSTFIISNHADELTLWTPLIACLSSPASPNPFLAIPCCSHALSGARHRYSPKDAIQTTIVDPDGEQPHTGDLKVLRATKRATPSNDNSMYGSLIRKFAALAQNMGCDVDLTLMRIPSTRNIGIVGNTRRSYGTGNQYAIVEDIIERECRSSGGVEAAAKIWVERAKKLQTSEGRGKVNEKRHQHGEGAK